MGTYLSSRRDVLLGGTLALMGTWASMPAKAATASYADLKKRNYLLYGFDGERPYNYMDPDGNLIGSEIDIARAVAKAIGIEEVQGVAMNFDSFIPAILAGRVDTCLPIFVKPERCKKIQFTRPHLVEGQTAVVAAGNPKGIRGWDDVASKDIRVGLIAGTTPNEIAKSAGVPDARITRFPDTTTMTAGMRSGRVDVIIEATGTMRLVLESLDKASFERVADWRKPTKYSGPIEFYAAFPFSLDASELRDAFDAELGKLLASGTIAQMTAKYGFLPSDRPASDAPSLEKLCGK